MAIDKNYTILISASFKGGRRIVLDKKPKYWGEKSLHIGNKVYSTSSNYEDKDAYPHHTEFAQDKEILEGIGKYSEKTYVLMYNKRQFKSLLEDIKNLNIEIKYPKLDKTNKERLQKRLTNSETIKSRMEEWFLDKGYSKTLDKLLEKHLPTITRKPRGVSKLSIKRYKKVFKEWRKLVNEESISDDEHLFGELSKIDYYNKPYTPATIKDIIDKKKYNIEPSKEKV